jgi:uncharacterized protein YhaN
MSSNSPKSSDNQTDLEPYALHFRHVSVQRLYGMDLGLDVDELCKGINVVYGANASGKTTLARAIRALFWPESVKDGMPIVSGRFALEDATWSVVLEGRELQCQKDGRSANPPALPPASHEKRYHLYLSDLLSATGEEDSFARLVLQEAQGGLDVEAAADELSYEVRTLRKSKLANRVEKYRNNVREAESQQAGIRDKERSLDALRQKLVDAQEAATRAAALEEAIEVAEARSEHASAEVALGEFPSAMTRVRGDEVETLDEVCGNISDANDDIDSADEDINEAETALGESAIPEGGLPEGRLAKIREKVSELSDTERKVRDIETDRAKEKKEESAAWERLSAGVDKETASALKLPDVQRVEAHVEAVEELQGRREALNTLQNLLEAEAPEESVETLRDGLRALVRWLQESQGASGEHTALWPKLIIGAATLVALVGVAAAATASGIIWWLGAALVALAILLAVAGWRVHTSQGTSSPTGGAAHKKEFKRTGLEAPSTWSVERVEEQVDRLLKRLREAAVAEEKRSEWERATPELDELQEREEAVVTERERLAEEIGFAPDISSRSLAWLLDRLSQWQSAYDDVQGLDDALATEERNVEELIDALNSLLAPYGLDGIEEGADAKESLVALESALDDYHETMGQLESAEDKKRRAKRDLEDAEEKMESLYERLGLNDGEEDKLRALVEQKEAYDEAVERERTAKTVLQTKLQGLRSLEGREEWMDEARREKLEREMENARAAADLEEEYVDEIKGIKNEIKAAQEGGTLEQRRATYRANRDELARDRHRNYERAVGAALSDYIQDKTQNQGLPPVHKRAHDLFADITNNRYELRLDHSGPTFYAFDKVNKQGFALDELSSGTKVQLLLSVRVAFVEHQEQGAKLPLILDETLANSDEERARAIIEAIQGISRTGRQVFYLTAQRDEVEKWNGARNRDDVAHQIIHLSEMDAVSTSYAGGDGHVVPTLSPQPEIPKDASPTHEELRDMLNVEEWSPRAPVSALHLWYLIDDPDLLLSLVWEGIVTWGQLKFQHRRGGLSAARMDEATFQRVESCARAVEAWQEAWQIGRGKPVGRAALQDSGAVSENFIDDVSDLADDLNGDAASLLSALREREDDRAKGFYDSKADQLEAYLEDEGYLDQRETKDPEEMWQFVIADLATERKNGVIGDEVLRQLFGRVSSS